MPNNAANRRPNDPQMGIGSPYFQVGSLLPSYYKEPTAALTSVSTGTTSSAINQHARGVAIQCVFSDNVTSCDILLYYVNSGDHLVQTFTGVNYSNAGGLFVGIAEGINLNGYPLKVRAQNFSGSGSVTVTLLSTE